MLPLARLFEPFESNATKAFPVESAVIAIG
jgi:hypothetical protein